MKNNSIIYLLVLIVPFILAGCTMPSWPSQTTNNNTVTQTKLSTTFGGLAVTLSTDINNIYVNTPFVVTGVIKNGGDQIANNVKIKLERISGSLSCDNFGKFIDATPNTLNKGEETIPITWTITPENVGKGEIRPIISYSYDTNAEWDVRVYSQSYIASSKNAREQFSSDKEILGFSGSKSPVVIQTNDRGTPLVYNGKDSVSSIMFLVSNPGNGKVSDLNMKVYADGKDITSQCTPASFDDTKITQINMGSKYPVNCKINIETDTSKSVHISVKLTYDYVNVIGNSFSFNIKSLS